MRRIVAALAAALAVTAGAAGVAQASQATPGLAAAAGSRFPDRAFALTLPRAASLSAAQVRVRENGRLVPHVTLRGADQVASVRFGVVLAIDTSLSMRGAPLEGAVAAARAFVLHRTPAQPVAIVTFAGDVRVQQPFTTDPAALSRALSSIHVTGKGSRVLDASLEAIGMIRASRVTSGSVVLLTDGADRGSRALEPAVTAAAQAAAVRFFTVGLKSGSADFGALNVLAATTSGEFSAATSASDLARVYARLGAQLANQYLIQYRSAAGPHEAVHVEVVVAGFPGKARAGYATPALDRAVRAPYEPDPSARLWASPAAPLLGSLLVGAFLTLGIWVLLRPRGGSLRERLDAYVLAAEMRAEDDQAEAAEARSFLARVAGSLRGGSRWASLKEKFDIGRIAIPPERAVTWAALATVLCLVALPVLIGVPGVAIALLIPLAGNMLVNRRVAKQRALFAEQLPDNLQVIASAMRAGHSFVGALQVVVEDAPEPARSELSTVIADERMGVPLEDAFATVCRRMESKDLEQVALVAALQRETGGNTAEVIDRVNTTMRERLALRRLVNALTAQGRMSRWVLTAIPVVLLLLLSVINPGYMRPLYHTGIGVVLLTLGAAMVTSGSLVIKRIVNIKV